MSIQDKIDYVMNYEWIVAIVCGAFIVICCICAVFSKKKTDTKGGYSLLALFGVSFAIMFIVCNFGGGAV